MKEIADLVRGKSVALVGNAESLLHRNDADEIDAHDVVVRINLGIPGFLAPEKVGRKSTIWATAKHFAVVRREHFKAIVFMKLTHMGTRDWTFFQREQVPIPLVRWPQELESEVKAFVGADPGTGIRMLYWLKRKAEPASVDVYGFDCWDTVSSWSKKMNTPNHVPSLERKALEALLA